MRIDVYLDDLPESLETIQPPESFCLDTTALTDGVHELRFVATDDDGVKSERRLTINVQNGPAIAVHGISEGDTVKGEVKLLANAYRPRTGDHFDSARIETPAPIPTWAWLLLLCVFAWGAGYVALEFGHRDALPLIAKASAQTNDSGNTQSDLPWLELGKQVYGNNCASCHRPSGDGVTGIFPPLSGNPAILDPDPTDHINSIIYGISGKVIEGIAYPGLMPAFGEILSDEEIAAVVNHERSQWGNEAPLVSAADVAGLRN